MDFDAAADVFRRTVWAPFALANNQANKAKAGALRGSLRDLADFSIWADTAQDAAHRLWGAQCILRQIKEHHAAQGGSPAPSQPPRAASNPDT